MKNYRFLLPLIMLTRSALFLRRRKVGTAEGQFLEISVGARGMGMGEAFTATADDISSIYFNPGFTGNLTRKEVMLSHIDLMAGISYEFAAFAMPLSMTGGVAGVSIYSLSTGDMMETTPAFPEGTGRTFSAGCFAAGLTYAQPLTDRFSAGITWKFINSAYADVSASSWAVDIGTIYKTEFKNFRIGMAMKNFGPDMKFLTNSAPLPMVFHLGVAGEVIETPVHKVTLSLEASHPNDNLEKFNIGSEYWWKNMVALRAGIKTQPDSAGSWAEVPGTGLHLIHYSFGAGVRVPVSSFMMKADYSFTDWGWFEPMHRFSLGMEF